MDLRWSEEQALLRDSAAKLLAAEYDWTRRQAILGSGAESDAMWRRFADMGWLALPISDDNGGLGGGEVDLNLLMRAFGAALVVEPYVPTVVLGAGAVAALGDERQRAAILPSIMDGSSRLALAHAETAGEPDPAWLETTAVTSRDGWIISGRKTMVLGAPCETLIVSARARDVTALFVVPRDAAGVNLDAYTLLDGRSAADVVLTEVAVAADAALGGGADAAGTLSRLLDRAVVALACDAVGAIDVLLDATVEYGKTRAQFGQPIGRFQAVQHRMADMAVRREEAAASALAACLTFCHAPPGPARAACSAKIKVARAARSVAEEAVQLHGAMGVTDELTVGAYLKRVLSFELLFGDADQHRRRLAAMLREPGFVGRGLVP